MAYSHTPRRYTIVGIDPGTTVGVAIIDLDGNPIEIFSSKNLSIADTITRIISWGKPLIVASDVTPTPSMVKKIGGLLSSLVHELEGSLSTEEKIALTKGEGYGYKNVHERDALAACIAAFNRYKKKFSQVQRKTPAGVDVEEVKALVVRGISIRAAINGLICAHEENVKGMEEKRQEEHEKKRGEGSEGKELSRLRELMKEKDERIAMLEELTTILRASVDEKEAEISSLKHKLESMRTERVKELKKVEEIRKRDVEIERLSQELSARERENAELRGIIEGLKGRREVSGGRRIKRIPSFSQDAIVMLDRKYGLEKGDIVLLEDGSGGGATTAELLVRKGVAAVLYGKELSHFAAAKFLACGIPTFSIDEIPVLARDPDGDFAFVDQDALNEKMEHWEQERRKPKVLLVR